MIARALSCNWIQIEVSDEAWQKSLAAHPDLVLEDVLDAITTPDDLYSDGKNTVYATRHVVEGRWLIVAYQEGEGEHGLFLDAFFSTKPRTPEMKVQL
jgi:hypothetical protein